MTTEPKDRKNQEGEVTEEQADQVAGGATQGDADDRKITQWDLRPRIEGGAE